MAGDLFNTVAGLTPGTDISNRYTLPFAPKHAVSLAADWTMLKTGSGELALHADYQWKDSAFLTGGAGPATPGSNLYVLPSRGIANARLTYSSELDGHKVSVSVWGRNVTDKKYVAHLFALGSVVSGYTNTLTAYAEPASYGVDLSMDF